MDKLFEKVGFICEYREKLEEFYRPYFFSEDEMREFFVQVFTHDDIDKSPRQMMNQIERLVSIANDIEKIRPGRDALRLVFLQTCIESLYSISNDNNGKYRKTDKAHFFIDMLDDAGKQYILDNFKFSYLEPAYDLDERESFLFDDHSSAVLTIEDFALLLYKIRGMVLHEGDYWSMQFFARDDNFTWIVSIKTDEKILYFQESEKRKPIYYSFETKMKYELFTEHFVKGCINFLKDYMSYKRYI